VRADWDGTAGHRGPADVQQLILVAGMRVVDHRAAPGSVVTGLCRSMGNASKLPIAKELLHAVGDHSARCI
jgi:hypothetical protein